MINSSDKPVVFAAKWVDEDKWVYLNNLYSTRTRCYTETLSRELKFNLTYNEEQIQL